MSRLNAMLIEDQGLPVVRLYGSLDSRTDNVLGGVFAELESRGVRKAVLDLTETEYVTAAGWGLILDRYRAWRRSGREFLISGMSVGVRSLFNFLELRLSLPSADSRAEAIARLTGRGRPFGYPAAA